MILTTAVVLTVTVAAVGLALSLLMRSLLLVISLEMYGSWPAGR